MLHLQLFYTKNFAFFGIEPNKILLKGLTMDKKDDIINKTNENRLRFIIK
jgi:hypothetical protein